MGVSPAARDFRASTYARAPIDPQGHWSHEARDSIIARALFVDLAGPAALTSALQMAKAQNVGAIDALISTNLIPVETIVARLARKLGANVLQLSDVPPNVLSTQGASKAMRSGILHLPDGRLIVAARNAPLVRIAGHLLVRRDLRERVFLASPRSFADAVLKAGANALAHRARTGPAALDARMSARGSGAGQSGFFVLSLAALAALATTIYSPFLASLGFAFLFLALTALRLLAVNAEVEEERSRRTDDSDLPIYTVLVPLYRERKCLPQLVHALSGLDYPASKLDIKFLVETDDRETREGLRRITLPHHFEVLVLPHGGPRTKPRALNIGLSLARGTYLAVFDAEDRPEPGQLRDALHGFGRGGPNLACVQARLAIDNTGDSWLTRLFTLEYAGLFDALLPGLAKMGLLFPLGGTSNHFRTVALNRAGGWDAWNVTEDADLGVRLARLGFGAQMISSTTLEEAPNTLSAWLKQRTRWLKGYVLTWVVHMRRPRQLLRDLGWRNFLVFHAFIGGVPLSAMMLPIFLTGLLAHIVLGTWLTPSGAVDMARNSLELLNLVLGFGTALAMAAIGAERRKLDNLAGWVAALPVYWLLSSAAVWRAMLQLLVAAHAWEKTEHGLARTSRLAGVRRVKAASEALPRPRRVSAPYSAA